MSTQIRAGLAPALAIALALLLNARPLQAQNVIPFAPHECQEGTQESGAIYRICVPDGWDGQSLVIYARGYVAPDEPIGIPEDQVQLPGTSLSIDQVLNGQGYAFAMSSFSTNGVAIQPGLADSIDVLQIFAAQYGLPAATTLLGISEGGLIATLGAERYPLLFQGAVALCGPYSSVRGQIDYFADFRVLFDYFFPEITLPNSPIDIDPALAANWDAIYAAEVQPIITDPANADRVDQLLAVANAPFDADDPAATKEATMAQLLWYNVIGTNDARAKLGGQPYDNRTRVYAGSADDAALNAAVARFSADPAALATMAADYASTGRLAVPLLTMHTDGDEVVPYAQAALYGEKVAAQGSGAFYRHIPVADTYGHCNFTALQLFAALAEYEELLAATPPFTPQRSYLPIVTAE